MYSIKDYMQGIDAKERGSLSPRINPLKGDL
jgi:hypothetical protein